MRKVSFFIAIGSVFISHLASADMINLTCKLSDEEAVRYYDSYLNGRFSEKNTLESRSDKILAASLSLTTRGVPEGLSLEVDKDINEIVDYGFAKDVFSQDEIEDNDFIGPESKIMLGKRISWGLDKVIIYNATPMHLSIHFINRTDLSYNLALTIPFETLYRGTCEAKSASRAF